MKHFALFLFLIFFQYNNRSYSAETSRPAEINRSTDRKNPTQQNIILLADEWCPFTCLENNKSGLGILPDLINSIFKNTPYKLTYKVINWARAIEIAKKNEANGVLGAYKSDIPDFIFPNVSQATSYDCFFGEANLNWKYTDFNSLKSKKIGLINGYSYGEKLDQFKNSLEGKTIFSETSGDDPLDQNIKKITSKRIDLLLENYIVIDYKKKYDPDSNNLKSYGCLDKKEIYVAFNPIDKNNLKLAQIVSDFLKSKNGKKELDNIFAKYLN